MEILDTPITETEVKTAKIILDEIAVEQARINQQQEVIQNSQKVILEKLDLLQKAIEK